MVQGLSPDGFQNPRHRRSDRCESTQALFETISDFSALVDNVRCDSYDHRTTSGSRKQWRAGVTWNEEDKMLSGSHSGVKKVTHYTRTDSPVTIIADRTKFVSYVGNRVSTVFTEQSHSGVLE